MEMACISVNKQITALNCSYTFNVTNSFEIFHLHSFSFANIVSSYLKFHVVFPLFPTSVISLSSIPFSFLIMSTEREKLRDVF